jgi:polyphenol oxidase
LRPAAGTGAGVFPGLPAGVRTVREPLVEGEVPLYVQPEWLDEMPWLVQGTTGSGADGAFDLGLFQDSPVGPTLRRWRLLRQVLGTARAVHSHQVHGRRIQDHGPGPDGLLVTEGYDGHRTGQPGVLLTVSVADCVPISAVDPDERRIVLLHGGWRGTGAGILPAGLSSLGAGRRVRVHLGPAICGPCYPVGAEVHQALGLKSPPAAAPLDIRAVLARQALAAGLAPEQVTVSDHCTRCGDGFFSHRGGARGRQVGLLALRA